MWTGKSAAKHQFKNGIREIQISVIPLVAEFSVQTMSTRSLTADAVVILYPVFYWVFLSLKIRISFVSIHTRRIMFL